MSVKRKQRQDGKTVYEIRVQFAGQRVSKTVPTTFTEAKRIESKILQDLINGTYQIGENKKNPKFREYASEYLQSVTWQKSYTRTETSVKNLIKFFGNKRLSEVTSKDFIDYRTLRLKYVTPATTNRERSCLLRMLNIVVKSGDYLRKKNLFADVKSLKEKPVGNRMLELPEYHRLLDASKEYFRRIMIFACNTGMRKKEILGLKFEQIKISGTEGEIELVDTKSGKVEYVPHNQDMIDLVLKIARERHIDLFNLDSTGRKEYVFLSLKGKPLKSVRKPMEYVFNKAGIEKRPFHTFRHFWTKMMLEAGNDPYTVQEVGRWKDFETMIKYCYTTKDQQHKSVNRLSEQLKKKTTSFKKVVAI
jgi:integrase